MGPNCLLADLSLLLSASASPVHLASICRQVRNNNQAKSGILHNNLVPQRCHWLLGRDKDRCWAAHGIAYVQPVA